MLGITWIPIAGVLFPLLIMLLVPLRQYLLPKFFKAAHLQDLDAAAYEEAPAVAYNMTFEDQTQARTTDIDSGEILDEIVTRSRGEIRRIQSPKITSVSPTPLQNINHSHSPRVSESTYSPRVRELRRERSAGLSGQGIEIKHSPSPRPSGLGKNSHGSPPV